MNISKYERKDRLMASMGTERISQTCHGVAGALVSRYKWRENSITKAVELMGDLSNVGPTGGQDSIYNFKAAYTHSGSASFAGCC